VARRGEELGRMRGRAVGADENLARARVEKLARLRVQVRDRLAVLSQGPVVDPRAGDSLVADLPALAEIPDPSVCSGQVQTKVDGAHVPPRLPSHQAEC